MRQRNREFNIFSISALDLFASAMGVFALIAIILFPYYLQTSDPAATRQLRTELEQLRGENEQLRKQLSRGFLVVVLRWNTRGQDVDLHVVNPRGQEFSYEQHNRDGGHFPGVAAFLTVDSRRGPGVEVWLEPIAAPGRYQIAANLYDRHGNSSNPTIQGKVYFRNGALTLPETVLNQWGRKVELATLVVDSEGNVSLGAAEE